MSQALVALLLTAQPAQPASPPWHEDGTVDGIRVEQRDVPGSPYRELRLSTVSSLDLKSLCDAVFAKGTHKPEGRFKERELLRETPTDHWTYERISVPIVHDRDYVMHVWLDEPQIPGRCEISFHTDDDPRHPPVRGVVRIPIVVGHWSIVQTGGVVDISYEVYSEPGGSVPPFLARGGQRDEAVKFMKTILARGQHAAQVKAAEQALRERLGIPAEAARVLVFCESSHWDTNWLQTSEEYFEHRLQPIFEAVMKALEADPERIYCVESVFFLKLFWERNPGAQPRLRNLIERRQLRLSASSFTTPDTLLPHPEAILRDFHLGQDWLRRNQLPVVPRTAYFPDNFGHSPHLPSLMRAVGVNAVVVTRIDGMYFIASDYRRRRAFPFEGSTAELLERTLKTLDFIWRDDDGAEVLCHWNAFTYFQGDMLAHAGITRWNGHVAALPWRTQGHVARRIDGFVRQLAPLARTPYLFCPIGMDFNDPIHDLRPLLTRYNRERSALTGTWTVLAGFDDYLELLGCHREQLPVLELDPNPYWMGFYASRPEVKQRPTRVARSLVLAENLSALAVPDVEIEASLHDAWAKLILINHHDAITGTSPDRVWEDEQRRWLDQAESAAARALALIAGKGPVAREAERVEATSPTGELRCWRDGGCVVVESPCYRLRFDEAKGGCLTSLVVDGDEQLDGPGFDLLAFADEGGLWRLGHEYAGGGFVEIDRASRRRASIEIARDGSGVTLRLRSELAGRRFLRTVTCRASDPFLLLAVEGAVPRRVTVTCRCDLPSGAQVLEMDTVGGSIERPPVRFHSPTFWPVPSLVSVRRDAHALHIGFEAPTAVSCDPKGSLEWIVARNALKERAFGFLPVMAHPIGGTSDEVQTHRSALLATGEAAVAAEVQRRIHLAWYPESQRALRRFADSLVRCDDPAVAIVALKRADVGGGVIVRLATDPGPRREVQVRVPSRVVRAAFRCDAREENLEPLAVHREAAVVPLSSRLTSIRLSVE